MATTSEAESREVIRRYFHGVNNEDWEDFAGIWHDDVVVDVSGGLHFEGREATLAYYPRVLKNFPVHYDDPYGVYVAGDIVTVEIAFTGETLEGVKASWEAVDVFTLRDGKIAKLATWYDMGHVVKLLRTPGVPEKRRASLVRLAAVTSPFYRTRLASLGLDPERVVAEPASLPPTTETDLASAPGEFLAAAPGDVRQVLVTPAGASVQLTRSDMEDAAWLLSRALELQGVTRDDVVSATTPHPALPDALLRLRARYAPVPGTPGVTAVVDGEAEDGARAIDLGRAVLETAVTGVIAASCGRGEGLHAFTDAHAVEIVDGELVVTPLGRRGTPVLRYATGIRAAWLAGSCPCGSTLPRIVPAAG